MGVAPGDYNGDGRTDLFVTNSRGQPHAVFASAPSPAGTPAFTHAANRLRDGAAAQADRRLG